MGEFATKDAIDGLAAAPFGRDHPERAWSATGDLRNRVGVASALERAVYRGFATARLMADARVLPQSAIASAALAPDARLSVEPAV